MSNTAAGDALKVLSSGFELRRQNEPLGPLPAPTELQAHEGLQPGEVDLRWKAVHGALCYHVFVNDTDPSDGTKWELLVISPKASHAAMGLKPGTYYWFRVSVVGTAGMSPYSDPAKGFATQAQ